MLKFKFWNWQCPYSSKTS